MSDLSFRPIPPLAYRTTHAQYERLCELVKSYTYKPGWLFEARPPTFEETIRNIYRPEVIITSSPQPDGRRHHWCEVFHPQMLVDHTTTMGTAQQVMDLIVAEGLRRIEQEIVRGGLRRDGEPVLRRP